MGYDLHITRKEFHATIEGPTVSPVEWLGIVQNDPELTLNKQNEHNRPFYADWSGPGKYPCWLDLDHGDLYTKNPTDEMIDKMVQIAKQLGAKVQGDEGEIYLGGGQATAQNHRGQWIVSSLTGQKPAT